MEEFLSLEYVGFDSIYDKIKHSNSTLLRIHLNDGTSFRISYWFEENIINPGAFGTEEMKKIMGNIIERKNNQEIKNKVSNENYDITGVVTEVNNELNRVLLRLTKKVQEDEEKMWVTVDENTKVTNEKAEDLSFEDLKQEIQLKANLTDECLEPNPRICFAEEVVIE